MRTYNWSPTIVSQVGAKRIGDGLAKSVKPRMPGGEKSSAKLSDLQEVLISGKQAYSSDLTPMDTP